MTCSMTLLNLFMTRYEQFVTNASYYVQYSFYKGELVNQIEFNVEHTAVYIQRAVKVTQDARNYKSKNRHVSISDHNLWVFFMIFAHI